MKVALCGLGKAGRQVLGEVYRDPETELVLALCRQGSDKAHKRLDEVLPVTLFHAPVYPLDEIEEAISQTKPDVIVDFSGKRAVKQLIRPCIEAGVNLVVATTGFTEKEITEFRTAVDGGQNNAMICAPNITLGVNVMMYLSELAAACLPEHDFVITEKLYKKKIEVSYTAVRLQERLSRILDHEVKVNSVRAGGYVGLHEVLCAGENERITIIHESFSRSAFAEGALFAAKHLMGKKGYVEMDDVTFAYIKECEAEMLKKRL